MKKVSFIVLSLLLCFEVDEEGLVLDNNYVAKVPENPYGGHATVCYGWNECGLLIQNSWGEKWGNKGTFILPYEYPIHEAWLITFKENDNEDIEPIVKPKNYIFREIIMAIINFIKKIFNKI